MLLIIVQHHRVSFCKDISFTHKWVNLSTYIMYLVVTKRVGRQVGIPNYSYILLLLMIPVETWLVTILKQ